MALKRGADPRNCVVITVQQQRCPLCSLDIYEGVISAPKKKRERDKIYAGGGTKAACELDWLPREEPK